MNFKNLALLVLLGFISGSCSNSLSSSSTPLASTVGLIKAGVQATGAGLEAGRILQKDRPTTTPFASTLCDVHGMPQLPTSEPDSGSIECPRCMPESDGRYPFVHTYCAMTGTDGDTVGGGFALAQSLICSLEKGGITFTGTPQDIVIDGTDTDCWPDGMPSNRPSLTISAKGTSPAEFNTHFEKGVEFSVSLGDTLTFKLGANVAGDKVEFIGHEYWPGTLQTGVMAGELTKSTGVLKFEKRDERIIDPAHHRDMGWNRHSRLIANLTMSGDTPTGLNSFEYGYADTQDSTPGPGIDDASAKIITAKGSPASEIKALLFSNTSLSTTDIKTIAVWSSAEVPNSYCANDSGVTDAACSTETGIGLFTTDTKFLLYDDQIPGHITPAQWLAAFGGFSATSVNLNDDVAYTPNP